MQKQFGWQRFSKICWGNQEKRSRGHDYFKETKGATGETGQRERRTPNKKAEKPQGLPELGMGGGVARRGGVRKSCEYLGRARDDGRKGPQDQARSRGEEQQQKLKHHNNHVFLPPTNQRHNNVKNNTGVAQKYVDQCHNDTTRAAHITHA